MPEDSGGPDGSGLVPEDHAQDNGEHESGKNVARSNFPSVSSRRLSMGPHPTMPPLPAHTSIRRQVSAPPDMEVLAPWSVVSFDSNSGMDSSRNNAPQMRRRHYKRVRRMSNLVSESYALFETRGASTGATTTTGAFPSDQRNNNPKHDSSDNMHHLMTSFRKSVQILQSRSPRGGPTVAPVPGRRVAEDEEEGLPIDRIQSAVSDFESATKMEKQSPTSSPDDSSVDDDETKEFRRLAKPTPWMSILYLSVFSMLGTWLRIFLGRLWGNECQLVEDDDAASTWLQKQVVTRLNLCVTSNGLATSPGGFGALFADLPANTLGCFLMGLLQPTHDLDLLSDVPMSFLPLKHWFQTCYVLHLGLRTGFCGSLTTLSSWNSQMVAMMDGSASPDSESQFFSAFVGYLIGLQCAVASLSMGQMFSVWLHRRANPQMAKEEDIVRFAYSKAAASSTTGADHRPHAINKKLPDYERRYLANLLPREQQEWAKKNVSALDDLEKWKISTDEYRLVGNVEDETLAALHEIERRILVEGESELPERLIQMAEQYGWNLEALKAFEYEVRGTWISGTTVDHEGDDASQASSSQQKSLRQGLLVSLPVVLALIVLFMYIILDFASSEQNGALFYREMWLSVILSPLGTLVRWKLARLNGSIKGRSEWFPIGTFYANILGCVISATTNGLSHSSHSWSSVGLPILYSIQTGVAGCMSTVSTYAVEGSMLQKSFPHHAKASLYMGSTLVVACLLGLALYVPIVRVL